MLALAPVGCVSEARHSGKEPLGDRRPYPSPDSPTSPSNDVPVATSGSGGRHVDELKLAGVVGTATYHRLDCDRLDGVGEADRIPFLSTYDGLDAGYLPCEHCRPGP